MRKLIKSWLLPLIISSGLFLLVLPALAQLTPEQQATLSEFLKDNSVEVGTEAKEGYSQIYYVYNGQKLFVTDTNYTKSNPVTEREYIAWMAQLDNGWRIFLHHIPTGITTQLTQSGINVNPLISGNRVAWEGLDENGVWQIFLFDGLKVTQITAGDMSVNPDIEGDFVVYGRKDLVGWRAVIYSLIEKKEKDITVGDSAQKPKLVNGKIKLPKDGGGIEDFGLNPADLFVLDFAPLTTVSPDVPETVTIEEILLELEATPISTESRTIEAITPTPEVTPSLTLTPSV